MVVLIHFMVISSLCVVHLRKFQLFCMCKFYHFICFIVFYATRFVTHCSLGLDCNEQRFSIIEGRCVNPAVPGAIPNWFGAPAYKLLPPTEDLFRAPICDQGKVHYDLLCSFITLHF